MRIISRTEWGARHRDGFGPAPLPATEVWLHHSAGPASNGASIIRELEAVGQRRFGGGISYTFLITPDGTVYEGHSIGREGAHTIGRNSRGRGICLVGNYDTQQPPAPMVASLVWLLRHGYAQAQAWWTAPRLTGGHRDVTKTACPGRHAYALIGEINRRAAQPQEDDMTEQHVIDAIYDVREQLTGARSSAPPLYPGWPTEVGNKTAVDMLRHLIERDVRIEAKLDELLERATDAQS